MRIQALPLAAALLAAAAVSQAQPTWTFPGPAGPQTGTGIGSGLPLYITPAGPDGRSPLNADMTYKCGLPPWRTCTPEEAAYRQKVTMSGMCPMPVVDSCAALIVRSGGGSAPQGLDPLTMTDDFYKKCGTVPYRNCTPDEQRAQDAWRSGQSVVTAPQTPAGSNSQEYGVPGGLVGPPCPPEVCNQAGNGDAAWASQFEEIKRMEPNAINVGSGKYIIADPENPGRVRECTAMMCARETVDAGRYSQYADQIQAAVANGNMFSATGLTGSGRTPPPASSTPPGASPRPTPAPSGGSAGQGGAAEDAGDIAAAQSAIGRGAGRGAGGVSGTGSGGGWSGSAAGGSGSESPVVKGEVPDVGSIETTFIPHQAMERRLEATRRDLDGGAVEEFVTSDGQTQRAKRGMIAEPPVDASVLGKQQFSANDGTAPQR